MVVVDAIIGPVHYANVIYVDYSVCVKVPSRIATRYAYSATIVIVHD